MTHHTSGGTGRTRGQSKSLWNEIVGQERAKSLLAGMIAARRVPPAIMLTGSGSVGKSLIARAFAFALSCRTAAACGECDACRANGFGEGFSVIDIAAIFAAEAEKNKAAALRRELATHSAAHALPWLAVVIERAGRMNEEMQAALLKAMEEPGPGVMYLLVTESPLEVLPTIRSRSLAVRCRPLSPEELATVLARADPALVSAKNRELLAHAEGSVTRARQLLSAYQSVQQMLSEILLTPPARGGQGPKRAEVLDRLALAVPVAARARPEWREALLRLDEAVAANALIPLALAVFRAEAEERAGDKPIPSPHRDF